MNQNSGSGFSVDQNGVVHVTQPTLDRDPPGGYPVWQINVIATVPGSNQRGYGIINIKPRDVNDNGPIFDMCCVVGEIGENNAESELLFIYYVLLCYNG